MLTFNQLLRTGGLDPATVRLLRHRDAKPKNHGALFAAGMNLDPRFAQYQERQGNPRVIAQFRAATHLAAFVAEPMTQSTVFVGVWERLEQRATRKDNPFEADPPTSQSIEFDTRRLELFDDYCGRLVIEWGDGTRTWVQRADNQDKPIIEVRRTKVDPPFPGFLTFRTALDQIEALWPSWVQVLSNARGIYLLVRRDTGEQYVGSATGALGFYGRWCNYQDGHGGNRGMRKVAAAAGEYDVNILEVAASDATVVDICGREHQWMTKLGTRVHGLNE